MVLSEVLSFVGSVLVNVCAGVVGNCITEPFFRYFSPSHTRSSSEGVVDSPAILEEITGHTPHTEAFSVLRRVLSTIFFHRGLFPEDHFKEWHTQTYDLTTKILEANSPPAQMLLALLDRGVYVAFQQEKVTRMMVSLCAGVGENYKIIEEYTFVIHYDSDGDVDANEPDESDSVKATFETLKKHMTTQAYKLDTKGPWKVHFQLTMAEMEKSIPFFERRDEEFYIVEGSESYIGCFTSGAVSFTLQVGTAGKIQNIEQSISSGDVASHFYIAELVHGLPT